MEGVFCMGCKKISTADQQAPTEIYPLRGLYPYMSIPRWSPSKRMKRVTIFTFLNFWQLLAFCIRCERQRKGKSAGTGLVNVRAGERVGGGPV
jgi:hypothetical protein